MTTPEVGSIPPEVRPARARALHAFGLTVPRPLVPSDCEATTLADVLVDALQRAAIAPQPGDVLAVSSKVVALFEGRTVRLDEIRPSLRARVLGKLFTKDPQKLELMFEDAGAPLLVPIRFLSRRRETQQVTEGLAADGLSVAAGAHRLERFEFYQSMHATLLNEAGIDIMNSPDGYVTRLPADPCASAKRLREALREKLGVDLSVIVTDTYSPIGRVGTLDLAIGYSGLDPVERKLFTRDLFGDLRPGDANLVIDTIAAMAGGVMGQTTEMTPAALVRGIATRPERADPARPGMAQLAYPRRIAALGIALSAVATVLYQIAWLLTWPLKHMTRNPRQRERHRGDAHTDQRTRPQADRE